MEKIRFKNRIKFRNIITFKKWWTPVGSNFIIVCMLVVLSLFTLTNQTKSVFVSESENLYYNGDTSQPCVSLMVNVYWGNEYLVDMLQTFKEYDITTTFFVGGSWVVKYPELLMQIYEDGHEIGNHGFFHKDQDTLNYEQNQTEIYNNHKLVKEYTGIDMTLFAPPSGAFSQTTLNVANNLGYSTIMWSKDTIDWRDQDKSLIIKRATTKIKNGDLILMHPTLQTALALPEIIESLIAQGFQIVTVSNNICGNID